MKKINFEEKKKALLRIFHKDFDDCRLAIYDFLPKALSDESIVFEGDTCLDIIKENVEKISTIRDNIWNLEDCDKEEDYEYDMSYFKKIDHQVFVDALVVEYNIDKEVAESICIDIYGKLF